MVQVRRKLPRAAKKKEIYTKPRTLKWEKDAYYRKSTFPQLKKKINDEILSTIDDRARKAICLDGPSFNFSKSLLHNYPSIKVDVCENNCEALERKKLYLARTSLGVALHACDMNTFVRTSRKISLLYADFTATLNQNDSLFFAIETNKSLFERKAVIAITYSSRTNVKNYLRKLKTSLIAIIDDVYDIRIPKIQESKTQKEILYIFLEKDFEFVNDYSYAPMHSVIFKKR